MHHFNGFRWFKGTSCKGRVFNGFIPASPRDDWYGWPEELASLLHSKDGVRYFSLTDGRNGFILAQNRDSNIGYAEYHQLSKNKGIYLDKFCVKEAFRKKHVGSQILRCLIKNEAKYLRHHNIFVHAYSSNTPNSLTQAQLESFYERYGFTLCRSEDAVLYLKISTPRNIRKNLNKRIKETRRIII